MDENYAEVTIKRDGVEVNITLSDPEDIILRGEVLAVCLDAIKGLGYHVPSDLDNWRDV